MLSDPTYFKLYSSSIGKNRIQLRELDTGNPEDIPVYTAAKEPVAFIKALKKKDPYEASENNQLLSFAANGDGSAGRNFVKHSSPFYISADRIAISISDSGISLDYVLSQLSGMKAEYGFNHSFKANLSNLSIVSLDIPLSDNGSFDMDVQEKLAILSQQVAQLKQEVTNKERQLQALIVEV